jgi:hypothetical protein
MHRIDRYNWLAHLVNSFIASPVTLILSSVLRYTLVTSDHLCAQVVVDDAHAAPPLIGGAVLRSP